MNDRNEIAQLRLLDAFLESGETDQHDWRDEIGAALDRARMSCLSAMKPMPECDGPPSAASVEDADILAQIEKMKITEAGREMASAEFNKYAKYCENIMDDDLEIASAVARRIRSNR